MENKEEDKKDNNGNNDGNNGNNVIKDEDNDVNQTMDALSENRVHVQIVPDVASNKIMIQICSLSCFCCLFSSKKNKENEV